MHFACVTDHLATGVCILKVREVDSRFKEKGYIFELASGTLMDAFIITTNLETQLITLLQMCVVVSFIKYNM